MHPSTRRAWLKQMTVATLLALGLSASQRPVCAEETKLLALQAQIDDDSVYLNYQVRFDLSTEVADALMKGVPVVFVARAEVRSERWYWSDKPLGTTERRMRLAFQPLTRRWRVNFDGLSQHFDSLQEALGVIQRNQRWRILDANRLTGKSQPYIDFTFALDQDDLPLPLQLGLTGQDQWDIHLERRVRLAP
jgi:Domain of unknown function (DUF4390)